MPLTVQRKRRSEERATERSSDHLKDPLGVAHHGTRGGGGELPHREAIQASFGQFDLGHVRAYTGAEAADATEEMGAHAYATGSDVAFAPGHADLHTAAHEAAHVVQQQSGVQLQSGVGSSTDRYERHADAVADAVVAGESAEPLLGEVSGGQADCCPKCHFEYEEKMAEAYLSPDITAKLKAEHAELDAAGHPPDAVLAHSKREMRWFEDLPPEAIAHIERDHDKLLGDAPSAPAPGTSVQLKCKDCKKG